MFENGRAFTEAEVKQAEDLLLILAQESAMFWAKAFLSPSFLYQGTVRYINSSYNKSDGWKDFPNENHIIKFFEAYMSEAKRLIGKLISSDRNVAMLLGMRERLNDVNFDYKSDDYSFGGWNNRPYGAVAVAKMEANLVGTMSVDSSFRNTKILLCKGKIYQWHRGMKNLML